MTKERASIFDDEAPELDASEFTTKPRGSGRPDAAAVREVAERAGFPSREASPQAAGRPRRGPLRTGRSMQLNLKVSSAYLERFHAAADVLGVSQAEAFERALEALEQKIAEN